MTGAMAIQGNDALQVLLLDAEGRGQYGGSVADRRAAVPKTWLRVPLKAGSSKHFGCGEACGETKAFDLPCNVAFDSQPVRGPLGGSLRG